MVSRELDHGRGNPTVKDSPLGEFIANGGESRRKGKPFMLFDAPAQSLNQPVEEPPLVEWEQEESNWSSPHHFPSGRSGKPDDEYDDTPSIQAAIDSDFTAAVTSGGSFPIAAVETRDGETRKAETFNKADLHSACHR